jgi:hypothetical protein
VDTLGSTQVVDADTFTVIPNSVALKALLNYMVFGKSRLVVPSDVKAILSQLGN